MGLTVKNTVKANSRYQSLEELVGNTPLVRLQRMAGTEGNDILLKLEGNNPAGSVKDRPALNMIREAERSGKIKPGDRLVEATSGNTGIALAMVAAMRGYDMILIMPQDSSEERKDAMRAYGAELIEVSAEEGMEGARDLAAKMAEKGEAIRLDQFANPANPSMHYKTTAAEIWQQTNGYLTHFISSMGTTGTITGCSRFFKEKNPAIEVIGLQPAEGARIPGIRKWPPAYLPAIFDDTYIDRIVTVSEKQAVSATCLLAKQEGICCGVSGGGAVSVALELAANKHGLVIVVIIPDRGDRYLSTGIFNQS